jgi:hypothetical protein
MVGCFETEMATLCVIRHMEPMETPLGGPMLNHYECPLMTRTSIIRFVSSNLVHRSVSVVHECDSGCAIQAEANATAIVERRAVSVKKTSFLHNWNNDLYCYNIFCMH